MLLMTQSELDEMIENSCAVCLRCGAVTEEVEQDKDHDCISCGSGRVKPIMCLMACGLVTTIKLRKAVQESTADGRVAQQFKNQTETKVDELRKEWNAD